MTPLEPRRYVGRFAPSPTGPLHFGSLLAALGSWLDARQHQGEWLVRIEDLDPPREVKGAAQHQLATLAAFGLLSDRNVLWQSQRRERYREALHELLQRDLAFPCSCTRAELAAHGQAHHACLHSPDPRHEALRLRVIKQNVAIHDRLRGELMQDVWAECGDFVLRRADGPYAYQLAVVVDDHDQGITDVVRGADLLESCGRQNLVYRAFEWSLPRYLHLPLVTDEAGRKLSKSSLALPVDGDNPLPALGAAWAALGQPEGVLPNRGSAINWLKAASAHFDWRQIGVASIVDRNLTG